MVSTLRDERLSNECSISGKDKDYLFTTVQIDHGAHPTSLPMSDDCFLPGGKP